DRRLAGGCHGQPAAARSREAEPPPPAAARGSPDAPAGTSPAGGGAGRRLRRGSGRPAGRARPPAGGAVGGDGARTEPGRGGPRRDGRPDDVRPSGRAGGRMTRLALWLIRAYQVSLSPLLGALGGGCRYFPSCSQYTYQAVERYGWIRGS